MSDIDKFDEIYNEKLAVHAIKMAKAFNSGDIISAKKYYHAILPLIEELGKLYISISADRKVSTFELEEFKEKYENPFIVIDKKIIFKKIRDMEGDGKDKKEVTAEDNLDNLEYTIELIRTNSSYMKSMYKANKMSEALKFYDIVSSNISIVEEAFKKFNKSTIVRPYDRRRFEDIIMSMKDLFVIKENKVIYEKLKADRAGKEDSKEEEKKKKELARIEEEKKEKEKKKEADDMKEVDDFIAKGNKDKNMVTLILNKLPDYSVGFYKAVSLIKAAYESKNKVEAISKLERFDEMKKYYRPLIPSGEEALDSISNLSFDYLIVKVSGDALTKLLNYRKELKGFYDASISKFNLIVKENDTYIHNADITKIATELGYVSKEKPSPSSTFDQDREIDLSQMSDEKCRQELGHYVSTVTPDQLKDMLHKVLQNRMKNGVYKKCANDMTISSNPIYMFSENQLILYNDTDSHTYCFDRNDSMTLLKDKVNPFNKKALSPDFIKELETIRKDPLKKQPIWPLDMALQVLYGKERCKIEEQPDDKTVYYYSKKKVNTKADLPSQFDVTDRGASAYLHAGYVYKLIIKNPYKDDVEVFRNDVRSMAEFYNPFTKESGYYPTEKDKVKLPFFQDGLVTKWVQYSIKEFNPIERKLLEDLNLKPKGPIRVFRGMGFNKGFGVFKDRDYFMIGDTFESTFEKPNSWSTNYCVSEFFQNSQGKGILVTATLEPKDIIIDLRLVKDNLYVDAYSQSEIVSVPNLKIKLTVIALSEDASYPDKSKHYDRKNNITDRTDYSLVDWS